MVGSPKILRLLQREFQQAKRASGEGEIRMDLMAEGSQEWKRFIKAIWRYQYTAEKVNLTVKMEEVFYAESVGNPFVASTLYKVVQDDAIISQKEKFGITDVRRISREKMGITAKMRSNMLAGIDVELNAYQHLWEAATSMDRLPDPKKSKETRHYTFGEDYNTMVTEISSRLEQAGVSINEARSYARQAIGAYPDDHNIDILYGYAMALYKATAKPE